MKARQLCRGSLVAAAGLAATVPAAAQTLPPSSWRYEATPYLWLTGVDVESRLRSSPVVRSNLTASEVVEKLDFAVMGALEARKGSWGVALDGVHASLSDDGSVTRAVSGIPVTVRGKVRVRQSMFSVGGLYRVLDGDRPVDLEAGLRYQRLGVRADLSASALGQLLLSTDPRFSRSWWDPYVGVRARMPLTPRWSVFGQADVGGFGVGSDITSQVLLGALYDISATHAARIGWRHLHVDVDRDGFRSESDTSGLFAGVTIRF